MSSRSENRESFLSDSAGGTLLAGAVLCVSLCTFWLPATAITQRPLPCLPGSSPLNPACLPLLAAASSTTSLSPPTAHPLPTSCLSVCGVGWGTRPTPLSSCPSHESLALPFFRDQTRASSLSLGCCNVRAHLPSGFLPDVLPPPRSGNLCTMPVTRSKSVGNTSALTSQLGIVRLLEVLFTCVTFSLVVHIDKWHGHNGSWCMFTWCASFAVTIVILVVEFAGLQHRIPVSWKNFPITFAMYATLMCLSASVIYPVTFIQNQNVPQRERPYLISATVFSCLSFLAYSTEVGLTKAKPGEVTGYMATVPGLLKVVETFIACIIFVFISSPVSYDSEAALQWCMAVYCICFILSLLVIILCIGECTGWLPCPFNKFLSGYTLLAVLMYATATIIWPIYKFDRKHGGDPSRHNSCSGTTMCYWDKLVAIAVLTAINLLVYVADLVYSARLIFIQG